MKFGICSEIFKDWNDTGRTIDYVKATGYDGLEIAPFTLADDVKDIPGAVRRDIRSRAEAADLEIIGLHWLLVGPTGVHLTHADPGVRKRTADYLTDLANFCADAGGTIMVFGSPKQRETLDGVTYRQAFDYAREVFERVLPVCEDRGVTICFEHLSPDETNFCNTAKDTVALIDAIGHANFQLLLDTKAMAKEEKSRAELIRQYAKYLKHYHANDENLEGPGFGDVAFASIFQALKEIHYTGYVSVEVFKFDPGPETIATKSLEYMNQFT